MSSQFHSKHVLAAAAAATTLTLIGCSGMPTNNAAPESPAVVTVTETSPASDARSEPPSSTESSTESEEPEQEYANSSQDKNSPNSGLSDTDDDSGVVTLNSSMELTKIGGMEPGSAKRQNVKIDATAHQKELGGFDTARITFPFEGANSLLTYPLVDGEANVRLLWNFSQTGGTETCENKVDVYDSEGKPTASASAGVTGQHTPCQIVRRFGEKAYTTFTEPGEYIVAVTAQQPGFEPITIAQKVKVVG